LLHFVTVCIEQHTFHPKKTKQKFENRRNGKHAGKT
jgi:hypothetical protein